MMTEFELLRNSSKLPAMKLLGQIGGLEMESGLDTEKVDGGVLETRSCAERSAEHG